MKFFYCIFLQVFIMLAVKAQTTVPGSPARQTDSAFTHVDTESSFPGGIPAWSRFLQDNLVYPKKAIKKNIQGTVMVRFIVDKDGSISAIDALDGPELLREAAMDVIKKSPNWKPASQYGRKVKSYKNQPIAFRLQ
jgi:protein TonB